MSSVNVHEEKTHLSRPLDLAHAGITKNGEPYARLVQLPGRRPKRQAGEA